jgi:hypothetical protein
MVTVPLTPLQLPIRPPHPPAIRNHAPLQPAVRDASSTGHSHREQLLSESPANCNHHPMAGLFHSLLTVIANAVRQSPSAELQGVSSPPREPKAGFTTTLHPMVRVIDKARVWRYNLGGAIEQPEPGAARSGRTRRSAPTLCSLPSMTRQIGVSAEHLSQSRTATKGRSRR